VIIPSIAEHCLLSVRGIASVIIAWELMFGHVLLVVLVWHGESKPSRGVGSTKNDVHQSIGVLLTWHNIEDNGMGICPHVVGENGAWSDHSTNDLAWRLDILKIVEDLLIPVHSSSIFHLARFLAHEDECGVKLGSFDLIVEVFHSFLLFSSDIVILHNLLMVEHSAVGVWSSIICHTTFGLLVA